MGGFAVIKPLSASNGKVCIKEIENYYSWCTIKAHFIVEILFQFSHWNWRHFDFWFNSDYVGMKPIINSEYIHVLGLKPIL